MQRSPCQIVGSFCQIPAFIEISLHITAKVEAWIIHPQERCGDSERNPPALIREKRSGGEDVFFVFGNLPGSEGPCPAKAKIQSSQWIEFKVKITVVLCPWREKKLQTAVLADRRQWLSGRGTDRSLSGLHTNPQVFSNAADLNGGFDSTGFQPARVGQSCGRDCRPIQLLHRFYRINRLHSSEFLSRSA